jgi:hypothetical protein
MHTQPISIAFVAATLAVAPGAALSEIYKWVEADGSVYYGNSPVARTKTARRVQLDAGTLSVVKGMSKEEKERFREREDQLRLQRLEREVEELRAREQSRVDAQPEIIYTEVYVPVYGYGQSLPRRNVDHAKPPRAHPIAKPRPLYRTPPVEEQSAARSPTGALSRR